MIEPYKVVVQAVLLINSKIRGSLTPQQINYLPYCISAQNPLRLKSISIQEMNQQSTPFENFLAQMLVGDEVCAHISLSPDRQALPEALREDFEYYDNYTMTLHTPKTVRYFYVSGVENYKLVETSHPFPSVINLTDAWEIYKNALTQMHALALAHHSLFAPHLAGALACMDNPTEAFKPNTNRLLENTTNEMAYQRATHAIAILNLYGGMGSFNDEPEIVDHFYTTGKNDLYKAALTVCAASYNAY